MVDPFNCRLRDVVDFQSDRQEKELVSDLAFASQYLVLLS